jgi:hypothetical protein
LIDEGCPAALRQLPNVPDDVIGQPGPEDTGTTTSLPPAPDGTTPPPPPTPTTGGNNVTNGTFIAVNNAIAQAFSSTAYNTNVLQQAAQNRAVTGINAYGVLQHENGYF